MDQFEKIGKYEVLSEIGEGNFGRTYRGRDPDGDFEVAIKTCTVDDENVRRKFAFQAEEAGKLHHQNIAAVLASGQEGDIPYVVHEQLSGQGLDQVIRGQAPLTPLEKLDQLLPIAEALAYAHQQGVFHSDLKPDNVRLLESGEVKILDFGIARLTSSENQLTQEGVTMGAASYLPPEQVRGGVVDHRSDVFSFGVLAYELLTFERPFRGNTLSALVYQILYKVPLPLTAVWGECPEALSDLISRCLDKKPSRRFQDFAELTPLLRDLRNRLAAGEWPDMQAALPPDQGHSTQQIVLKVADDDLVVSQEELSRTALSFSQQGSAEVERDQPVGEYTLAPGDAENLLGTPLELGDPDSTQPVEPILDPAHDARSLVGLDPDDSMILASRGQAIGNLVAEGKLDEALQQLEETVTLHRDGTLAGELAAIDLPDPEATFDPPPPTDSAPSEPTKPEALKADPGGRLDFLRARVASAEAKSKLSEQELPEWALKAGPIETTKPLSAPGKPRQELDFQKLSAKGVASPPPPAPVEPKLSSSAGWLKMAAAAALLLAVVAVVALIWFLLPDKEQNQNTQPAVAESLPQPELVPAEPDQALGAAELGAVVINAVPWARVTEITDAAGVAQELPEESYTPLYVELSPGSYAITLQHPDVEELFTCTIEIESGFIESCETEFHRLDPTEYFKSSGWWS